MINVTTVLAPQCGAGAVFLEEKIMIITVTLNPAIDKTVNIQRLEAGGLNRIKHVETDIGGKGINVSKTIHQLGGQSIAVGFIAGSSGRLIEKLMKETGIMSDFIHIKGETRTNTKICEADGRVTELNEPGAEVTTEELNVLEGKILGYVDKDALVVLAGSAPVGVDTGIYARLIRGIHNKGGRVLMDADGELFAKGIEAIPDIIKPNREELQKYFGIECADASEELLKYAGKIMKKGIKNIAVSMGSKGAFFIGEDYCYKCPGLCVQALSTVGAGDAMVAAMAYSIDKGLDREEMIKYCMAASAGAVTTIGTKPPSKELVEILKTEVELISSPLFFV